VFSWLVKKRQILTHKRPQFKMLSSEDVFKNTVLPSRVISTGVNSPDGVHWAHGLACHIHEINGTSEVEVDAASKMQKPLPGKGVSSRSTGRGLNDIPRLQSDSAAEINRHQHWVCHKTSSTQDHNVFADLCFMFYAMTGVAVAFLLMACKYLNSCSGTDLHQGQGNGFSEQCLTSLRVAWLALTDNTHSRSSKMTFTMQPLKLT
jgi:hypothetical protein